MSNPIKPSLKSEGIPILLILITFVAGCYFYTHFPDKVPSHWNYKGEVDGYAKPGMAAFLLPITNVGLYLMMLGLPYLNPKRDQYSKFARPYHIMKGALMVFMTFFYFYTGLAGLGYKLISMNTFIFLGMGVLFSIIGNYLGKVKTNWFTGIRTPWTLSNEEVWNKTHRLGGKLFVIAGLLLVVGAFLPTFYCWSIFIISMVVSCIVPIGYSWWLYRKLVK